MGNKKLSCLITGSGGFVGAETIKILEPAGHEIIKYDLMDGKDICDFQQLEKTVIETQPDRILHLAAVARFADADANPRRAFETNAIGTGNIAALARKYHVPVVYSSTGSVYMPINLEPPITEKFPVKGNSVYGCTKCLGEKYIEECNPYIILRYAHLYGAEKRMHGLIGGYLDRINRGLAPTLYGGKQSNDFTYILDVAEANKKALEAPWDKWNQAYNIGTGEQLSAEDAGNVVCRLTGYTGEIERVPAREVDPMKFVFDVSKASNMLGFTAKYSFEKGLEHMFKEMKDGETK